MKYLVLKLLKVPTNHHQFLEVSNNQHYRLLFIHPQIVTFLCPFPLESPSTYKEVYLSNILLFLHDVYHRQSIIIVLVAKSSAVWIMCFVNETERSNDYYYFYLVTPLLNTFVATMSSVVRHALAI